MTTTSASVPAGRKAAAPRLRSVDVSGPAGRLEAVVNEGAAGAAFAAVVCHPHPKGGGTLHNKVVYHVMKALNAPEWGFGWPVLRFNFRGVGRSEGRHDGKAEAGDVLAAIRWIRQEYELPVVVAGFSFGAAMALRACTQAEADARAVIALGLPTHAEGRSYSYPFLAALKIPKLLLSGDRDQYASSAELEAIASYASDPKQLVLVPGADHFFVGQLERMQSALTGWLKEQAL